LSTQAEASAALVSAILSAIGKPIDEHTYGTVTAVGATSVTVQIDGTATANEMNTIAAVAVDDRVLVYRRGDAWICMGTVGGGSAGGMTLIQDSLLVAPAASVVFAAIPQTFRNLRLIANVKINVTSAVYLRFNGDAGANYDDVTFFGSAVGDTSHTYQDLAYNGAQIGVAGTDSNAGYSSPLTAEIPDYASAAFFKNAIGQSAYRWSSAGERTDIGQAAGWWLNTAPITQVTVLVTNFGATFAAGSRFMLYGY
jgi:hypothetical protein